MNKGKSVADQKLQCTLPGEASKGDLGALLCDGIMLGILLWNQFRYGMDMLFLILPLVLVGIYILFFCAVPENYQFTENRLEIVHPFRKKNRIPYESVFNYEATKQDAFINVMQKNVVKVYYFAEKKKKLAICRPINVTAFTEALRANCPEFHTEEKTKLEVFFEKSGQD